MKLSPICWAAAFPAALPCRRALRRGPSAGTEAVPGGGTGGAEIRSMETPLRVRPYSSSEVQNRLQQLPDGTTTSYTAYRYPTSLQGDSIQQEHKNTANTNTTRIFESKEHRALEPQQPTSDRLVERTRAQHRARGAILGIAPYS